MASAEVERGSGNTQTPYVNGPQTLKKNFHFRVIVDPGKGEIEKTFWTSIERSSDAADFEAYLRKYPNGSYRALAENQIKRLKASQPAAPAPVAAPQPAPAAVSPAPTLAAPARSDDAEGDFWKEVKTSGAREYLDAYLKQYPKGKYASLAKIELKKLNDKDKAQKAKEEADRKAAQAKEEAERKLAAQREKQEAVRAEQEAWERAKSGHAAAAYAGYLEAYPKGRYAALAQAAHSKLQREEAEREKQDAARRAREAQQAEQRRQAAQRDAEERARQDAARLAKEAAEMRPGKVFKDCADCPEMVMIPAGSFEMGDSSTHSVRIGKPFAVGRTEVTQKQWRAVMGSDPPELRFKGCDDCPVERVNWNDAKEFITKLSQKTGKTYRLPSEAEWEYACRAGSRNEYCGGDNVDSVAWYDKNSGGKTHAVAGKQANAWGLHDMSGNVWEWVEDCWNGSYNGAPSDGSAWTSGDCSQRVLRGGSCYITPDNSRAAFRVRIVSSYRDGSIGFRLARMLP